MTGERLKKLSKLQLQTQAGPEMDLPLLKPKRTVGELPLPLLLPRISTTGVLPPPLPLNPLLQLELPLRSTLVDSQCSVDKEPQKSTSRPPECRLKVLPLWNYLLTWLSQTVMPTATLLRE